MLPLAIYVIPRLIFCYHVGRRREELGTRLALVCSDLPTGESNTPLSLGLAIMSHLSYLLPLAYAKRGSDVMSDISCHMGKVTLRDLRAERSNQTVECMISCV